jgi:transposase
MRGRFLARLDVVGNVSVVARELGVNRNTAFGWARKSGRRSVRLPRRHPGRDDERLRAEGVARRAAARQVGVNERTAKDWDWGVKKSGTARTFADGRRVDYTTGTVTMCGVTTASVALTALEKQLHPRFLTLAEREQIRDFRALGQSLRALPAASRTALRGPTVRRMLAVRAASGLTAGHVRVAADALGVTERTVWRWLAAAERDEAAAAEPGARTREGARFTVTPEVRRLLALWKGNVRAVHRELTARAARQSPPAHAPSLTTLHRALRRDLDPGERAGLAGRERAARKHDVFLARRRGWRNQVWETDHVQAPVLVDVEGTARRRWITWFTDSATNAITGLAVTPGYPSRESVLAALRSAVLREDPYGPFGGLPDKVRVDRGKDFLSATVTAAFDLLDVTVEDLVRCGKGVPVR